ncbi:MAG: dCTP deaminase [Candidatus Omnitrophota bacterium]
MKFCSGQEIAVVLTGLISEKHQIHKYSVDLTVGKVYSMKKEGDLDFGGSEEKEALIEQIKPVKRTPGDKYGWWNLTAGQYMVEYNEKAVVPEKCLCILQPLLRTLGAGAMHPTLVFCSGEMVERIVVIVGKSGLNIKENARISSIMGIEAVEVKE